MDLIELFFQPEYWYNAIDKSIDKGLDKGMLRYMSSAEGRLKLFDQIANGDYHIKPPEVKKIPKDNGKFREIYINSPKDRIVLSIINSIWNDEHPELISPACKAYLVGNSCAKTVREVSHKELHGYKLDLSKYFDSVSIETINKCLDKLDTHTPLDDAIREYYNTNIVIENKKKVTRYKSLAQGCALSAFLSNAVLFDIDARMLELCDYYCRYSDDMLILGPNADKALVELKIMLADIGLSLNPDKIEKIIPTSEFKFLGFGLQGHKILISKKSLAEKKKAVQHITKLISHNKSLSPEQKLKRAVREVKYLFINHSDPCHGWLYGKSLAVNDLERIEYLDKFCKEHIRASVTGKWNYTTNVHKVTEEMLRNAGYVSLVHMFKIAQINRDLFLQEHLTWTQPIR